ncbi:MAG TPA: hypothetical protein VHC46_10525 [Thermodesulfobacteriota bacterium]|nr:hypothetical protein [Candidatus Paceibacterota bacterium]HVY56178.1 hypothetical protein [Thermodesulfobacteriota bacterium]
MEFTPEQKKEAFKKLPPILRNFMLSDDFTRDLSATGKDNSLLLDKLGLLEDEVFMVLYGLKQSADFVPSIEKRLAIAHEAAIRIGEQVNRTIFLKIREKMQEADSAESQMPKEEAPSNDRDQILSEIENPAPAVHPISAADQTIPGPAKPREIVPEPSKDAVSKDFIAEKMKAPVNMPTKYASDPYREPLA